MAQVTFVDLDENDTYGFGCEACGYSSTGWGTKKARDARRAEHRREHDELQPMSELVDFRAAHGIDA